MTIAVNFSSLLHYRIRLAKCNYLWLLQQFVSKDLHWMLFCLGLQFPYKPYRITNSAHGWRLRWVLDPLRRFLARWLAHHQDLLWHILQGHGKARLCVDRKRPVRPIWEQNRQLQWVSRSSNQSTLIYCTCGTGVSVPC